MAIRVAWDRTPVSVHGTRDELTALVHHLRNNHSFRKHSIIMPDRENDEEAETTSEEEECEGEEGEEEEEEEEEGKREEEEADEKE